MKRVGLVVIAVVAFLTWPQPRPLAEPYVPPPPGTPFAMEIRLEVNESGPVEETRVFRLHQTEAGGGRFWAWALPGTWWPGDPLPEAGLSGRLKPTEMEAFRGVVGGLDLERLPGVKVGGGSGRVIVDLRVGRTSVRFDCSPGWWYPTPRHQELMHTLEGTVVFRALERLSTPAEEDP